MNPYREEALNLINKAPPEPISITTLIQNLNNKRNLLITTWLNLPDELRILNSCPEAPIAVTAANVEKEYTVLYKE